MRDLYVVTGCTEYEGETVLGAFGSAAAAEYFARRVDLVKAGHDEVEVRAWRGPTHVERVYVRAREW